MLFIHKRKASVSLREPQDWQKVKEKKKKKNNSRKHNSVGSKYVRRHGRLVKFRGRQKTRAGGNCNGVSWEKAPLLTRFLKMLCDWILLKNLFVDKNCKHLNVYSKPKDDICRPTFNYLIVSYWSLVQQYSVPWTLRNSHKSQLICSSGFNLPQSWLILAETWQSFLLDFPRNLSKCLDIIV